MGQCSTLPAETGHRASTSSYAEQRHRLRDDGRKESLDFNKLVDQDPEMPTEEAKAILSARISKDSTPVPVTSESLNPARQARDPGVVRAGNNSPIPMEMDKREELPSMFRALPPPPANATRTRCYKLNLDSEIIGTSSSQKQSVLIGPFSEPPPYLTYSSSEDSDGDLSATQVAIRTAQIFRGITVSRDGTILSQNARATRSNRGKGQKRGEKSRQAAKIDKAKDLVEDTIASGKAPDSEEPAVMQSLVIVGEYDDMKHLVRDGSKKLRDAEGMPDEELTVANQPRTSENKEAGSSISPRKRVSPSLVSSQRTAALQSPEKIQATSLPLSQQTAPPKLKSNPRDTRPARREGSKMRLDSCGDFVDPRRPAGVDGDWGQAWNIWGCGGAGAVSPFQPSSPTENAAVFERREAAHNAREGALSTRAD